MVPNYGLAHGLLITARTARLKLPDGQRLLAGGYLAMIAETTRQIHHERARMTFLTDL